jgi:hypothetical protein
LAREGGVGRRGETIRQEGYWRQGLPGYDWILRPSGSGHAEGVEVGSLHEENDCYLSVEDGASSRSDHQICCEDSLKADDRYKAKRLELFKEIRKKSFELSLFPDG